MRAKRFDELVVGDRVCAVVAVLKRAEVGTTKKGSTFIKWQVSDESGVPLLAKRWDATTVEADDARAGGHLWGYVVGEVTSYDGALEIKLTQPFRPAEEPDDPSPYIPTSTVPLNDLRARLSEFIDSVRHPALHALLSEVFVKDVKMAQRFESLPAAEKRHHAFRHGLLQHTLEVADVVDAICEKQRLWGAGRGRVSRDLAITGALLHDIGKLEEYGPDGHGVCFTTGGGLLGHVTLGVVRVARKIAQARKGVPFPEELEELVLHTITAHHGKAEYGAPKPPMTAEAALIHYADVVSAECFYFAEAEANAEDGVPLFKQWKLDDRGRHVFVGALDGVWDEQPTPNGVGAVASPSTPVGATPPSPPLPSSVPALSLPLVRVQRRGTDQNFGTVRNLAVLGKVAAGVPIFDSDSAEEEVSVEGDALRFGRGDYYLLRVEGDSMIGDGILDGDLIVVRHQEQAEMGDIVVAMLEDGGATVKRLAIQNGQVALEASNPEYAPIMVGDPEGLAIKGRVVAVAR